MKPPKSPWLFAALCALAVTLTSLAAAAVMRLEAPVGALAP